MFQPLKAVSTFPGNHAFDAGMEFRITRVRA